MPRKGEVTEVPTQSTNYRCKLCKKRFKHLRSLRHHAETFHNGPQHKCETCHKKFGRFSELQHHHKHSHAEKTHKCNDCSSGFHSQLDLAAHRNQDHPSLVPVERYNNREPESELLNYFLMQDAISSSIQIYRVKPNDHTFRDLLSYKKVALPLLSYLIRVGVNKERAIKWHVRLTCEFARFIEVEENCTIAFTSAVKIALLRNSQEIDSGLGDVFSYFQQAIEDFQEMGSGWELNACGSVCDLYLARYRPLRASSYMVLPKWLRNRKSIINIQNKNSQDCFILSILAAIYPEKTNPHRPGNYEKFRNMVDCSNIVYPVSLDQIGAFEKANQISVNVYGIDVSSIVLLRQSKLDTFAISVNLLLIESQTRQHYCLIRNLDQFMRTSKHATFVCRKCLLSFNTNHNRNRHQDNCSSDHQVMELPTERNKFIKFKNVFKMHRLPLIFVADIETVIRPVLGPIPNPARSYTMATSRHDVLLAAARGVFQCCGINTRHYINIPIQEGEDGMVNIVSAIIVHGMRHQEQISSKKIIIMQREDWKRFHASKVCEICQSDFKSKKCRDHCHFCGRYRKALCRECNFQYYVSRHVHVYLHNFSGFDSAFVVPALAKIAKIHNYKLNCIAKGAEKFITVGMKIPYKNFRGESRTWSVKFFDTLQFLDGKLEVLVSALEREGSDRFHATDYEFGAFRNLFMRKQVFPYSYINDEKRLDECSLPPESSFYNDLTDEAISNSDYQYAKYVWATMKCVTLRDYYKVYLMCDITLLIDVWENFRELTIRYYKLDAACYLTGSALTYDAMLLYTGVTLELISDIDMYDLVSRGIRGGLSMVSNRLEFSNERGYNDYDLDLPENVLFFVDAVNLYGWSMQQPLALGGYRWLTTQEIRDFDLQSKPFGDKVGFLIDCDLSYPSEIHDAHNSNPLAPELMKVTDSFLSDMQLMQKEMLNSSGQPVAKLITHFGPRLNYVLDYRNLQLYLQLGMKLEKVHRILRFDQNAWMRPYIQFNTEMRQKATSQFQKALFKRMNNSAFGKQLEDPAKYRNTVLCTQSKQVEKLVRRPNYSGSTVYGDDLVCVHMRQVKVRLTKMRIVGCQITELAKLKMQDYYYNCLHRTFGDKLSLIVHDTDSYLISVKSEPDFYKKMSALINWHDFSTLPTDHVLYDTSNKGIPGKMAPECNGRRITGVAAIRAKCYAIQFEDGNEKKTLKGISKIVRDKKLRFADYLKCLTMNCSGRRDVMKMLRKVDGVMVTLVLNKSSLVNYDDKRHILSLTKTYAHGHYAIKKK